MTVEAILKRKGVRVSTIGKEATIAAAAQRLNLDHIGALVVVEGPRVVGILSERDIIGGLAHQGVIALEKRVEELMTWPVVTRYCLPPVAMTASMNVRPFPSLVVTSRYLTIRAPKASTNRVGRPRSDAGQVIRELLAHEEPGPVHPGLHRGQADPQRLGDLGVRDPLDVVQDQRGPVFRR